MKKLVILINNEVAFEFNTDLTLEDEQLVFLDKMDNDMQLGIKISGELLVNPDKHQRATFIAMNLIKALQQDNGAAISSSGAYLANRYPELMEVHANDDGNTVKIELIEKQQHQENI